MADGTVTGAADRTQSHDHAANDCLALITGIAAARIELAAPAEISDAVDVPAGERRQTDLVPIPGPPR